MAQSTIITDDTWDSAQSLATSHHDDDATSPTFPVADPSLGNNPSLAEDDKEIEYGPDIQAWYNNETRARHWIDYRGRHHLIHNTDRAFADRIIHYSYHQAHPSEKGWNLPREHRHHFLNFPREIRDQILGYILIATATITPKVIICSWKRELQLPGYAVEGLERGLKMKSIRIHHRDRTELREVFTKPIDATCLRVNKQLNDEGSKLLYGRNHFNCSIAHDAVRRYGGLYTISHKGFPMLRRANMWKVQKIGNGRFMKIVKGLWKNHQAADALPGFVYCDPFLRFLYTIGPKNTAILRNVTLQGYFTDRHHCTPLHCDQDCRGVCLLYYLRLYGPFVAEHCNLQRLVLHGPLLANYEWGCDNWEAELQAPQEPAVTKMQLYEKYLPLVLKSEIWKFPTLRDIEVKLIVNFYGTMPTLTLEEMRREVSTCGVAGHNAFEGKSHQNVHLC